MPITVALRHRTEYRYDRPVSLTPQVVRLRPAPHCRTAVRGYGLQVEPADHFCNWQQDPQGNWQARLVFPQPTARFSVQVDLVAELAVVNPFDFFLEESAERIPFAYEPALARELRPFLEAAPAGPLLAGFLAGIPRDPRPSVDALVAINLRLNQAIRYLIRLEPGVQDPEETLAKASGSCRDSAWLLVQVLRHLGLAARFVSGYLVQLVADEKPLDGPAGPERDFTDLHAWCEVYLPGAGWVGLDPTSGLFAGEGHLPLAATPDPQGAAPISGAFSFAPRHDGDQPECAFEVVMEVSRVHEPPRVTLPYAPEQIAAIEAVGLDLDARMAGDGLGLTMGGEPTFVAVDDPDGEEWNTAALGPAKRRTARALAERLLDAFAPGGVLHCGQGKWYPGEQLPRWAFSLLWRPDGAPCWRDRALLADERRPAGHGPAEAERLARALAAGLGVDPRFLIPGHEDAWYQLWRERRLPVNVDPLDSRLDDPLERERLARVFRQGLGATVGWAMPLRHDGAGWVSGPWFLREEHLFLLPGDSPMGFRLPLDSLPWAAPGERPADPARDPLAPAAPFAGPAPVRVRQAGPWAPPEPGASHAATVRSALCIEPRGGVLHVFLPPVADAAAWLDLVAAVEDAAAATGLAVQLEGYQAPHDHRLRLLQVTPDPGVIEVNIHPAGSWSELAGTTRRLYAEARQCRLGSEKFLLDGRHAGTGGGNHITLGGATPAASPFLQRPGLLASLVGYWHNHPALSYLFSGLFIGPTSQAPRADEGRTGQAYELATALRQLPPPAGGPCPPWLTDRVLRHLLVDATGNTHRAEICIDKLYNPDSAAGRRGLVELRAFEMPPHAEMSLAQQLLVRALVARFWRTPYRAPLAAWGTQLIDRWTLPWALRQDLHEILAELRADGIALDDAWFEPHCEFRFPRAGAVVDRGVELELRTALEPWHVLGEEAGAGGTVRYVDSSVERLQVRLAGATPGRHAVAVNGRWCPLRPTGTAGEYVCGVRFRAWRPPSCLHPTIGVHAPLSFTLVDTWNARALAGCTYHVAHPGGRNYATRPVNANEAEARRAARFQPFGLGQLPPSAPGMAGEADCPFTLDLRRDA